MDRVFVYYPRGQRTGGPEALHQLGAALLQLGIDVQLVPLPGTEDAAEVESYAHYGCPYADRVVDAPGTAVVAAETNVKLLARLQHATPVVWWLSIDNAPLFAAERLVDPDLATRARTIGHLLGRQWVTRTSLSPRATRVLLGRAVSCVQSAYAWSYLNVREDLSPAMLSDYTLLDDFEPLGGVSPAERGRTVAYNPAKGGAVVERLAVTRPDIEWRPIRGMNRDQVVDLLRHAAIYLDLGHHPGKDRLPREAALCGAAVVVARRGAGAYAADVPLPEEQRVAVQGDVVAAASRALDDTFATLDRTSELQRPLVAAIQGERERFLGEVAAVFRDHRFRSAGPAPSLSGD